MRSSALKIAICFVAGCGAPSSADFRLTQFAPRPRLAPHRFSAHWKVACPSACCRGMTLIEILVTVAIVGILAALLTGAFSAYNRSHALAASAEDIRSFIELARSKTLSSRGDTQYGVYIGSDSLTLFSGDSFNPADPSNVIDELELHAYVTVQDVALASGVTQQLVFERLTGATSQPGTITVALKTDSSKTETITIEPTGFTH